MQTLGLLQTFENYLFSRRLTPRRTGRGRGSDAGQGTITGAEAKAEVWTGPRDAQRRRTHGGEGCVIRGRVFEQVEGISDTVNTAALDKTVLSYLSV